MILSVPRRTLPGMTTPDPWTRAGDEWAHIQIVRMDLGNRHRHGETRWLNGRPVAIVLNSCLNQRERRCTLAHEIEHLERGQPCGSLRAVIEARVCADTARYLLPDLEQIGKTLAVYDLRQAAAELWVTYKVLIDRLNGLTNDQSLYVHSFREDIA
jgi:Zn-dependent peptidase ImmA (M78 family)